MTSGLYVPKHVREENAEKAKIASLQDAYVKPEEVVLDPSKLNEEQLNRLPKPQGWRILILPYAGPKVSKGGIHMPDSVTDTQTRATVVGYVLETGGDAYADKDKFPNGAWCKKGDWVIYGRYAGARFKIDGGELRLLNDDEVLAVIESPDDILHV